MVHYKFVILVPLEISNDIRTMSVPVVFYIRSFMGMWILTEIDVREAERIR